MTSDLHALRVPWQALALVALLSLVCAAWCWSWGAPTWLTTLNAVMGVWNAFRAVWRWFQGMAIERLTSVVVVLALTGCATTLPMDASRMTPEQIKEAVKDKSANIGCVSIKAPYPGNSVLVNLDKGILTVGEVTVTPDCTVTIRNEPTAPRVTP